jgi:hypothetical protein
MLIGLAVHAGRNFVPSLQSLLTRAAFGCGLALAQGDFLFAVVFCAASVVTIIEAIRRSR